MRKPYEQYSLRRQAGLTLVEAMAGSALLGTLMVSILLAGGQFRAQQGAARRRVEACAIADGLLRKWWPDRMKFPRGKSGKVAGRAGWTWRTECRSCQAAEAMRAVVVTLEVMPPDSDEPAARVDILLPKLNGEGGDGRPQGDDAD